MKMGSLRACKHPSSAQAAAFPKPKPGFSIFEAHVVLPLHSD